MIKIEREDALRPHLVFEKVIKSKLKKKESKSEKRWYKCEQIYNEIRIVVHPRSKKSQRSQRIEVKNVAKKVKTKN